MSRRIPVLIAALGLAAITLLALGEDGLKGFYLHHRSWGGFQVFLDLVIMALLGCAWMVRDARRRGVPAWPWVALTLAAGSFGPLAYLARHPGSGAGPREEPSWALPLGWRILLGVVTLLFAGLTLQALRVHGYFGVWRLQFLSWTSRQVLVDLAILCCLASGVMIADARRLGRTVWPFLLLTLAAGSFGPLAYLLSAQGPGETVD